MEKSKHGKTGRASMRAGMDRKTGRKYIRLGQLPSELGVKERLYRTREDVFAEDWPMIEKMMTDAPALEAKTIFDWMNEEEPGKYEPGQLRTLQRKIHRWRVTEGPEREVFFGQEHRPGEAMQMDFTHCDKLNVTIAGEFFPHMLCHGVLPYSNWEWGTTARSESLMALKRGVQDTVFRLGHVPEYLQSDNLSAATHDLGAGGRAFNEDYKEFVAYYGMTPRKIGVGKCNQNGDVESSHNVLKRRLEQYLILRGSRDFESEEAYESWVQGILSKTNAPRTTKLEEELKVMRELTVSRLSEHKEVVVRVSRESTIRVMNNTYSVPSRLCGEKMTAHVYDAQLELYFGGVLQLRVERLIGSGKHRIDYRHIIWSLVQKPGAFPRYRYREEMFPSMIFRKAYDALNEHLGCGYKSDLEYLRILHRAASVSETEVEAALMLLLSEKVPPLADKVKSLVQIQEPEIPAMTPFEVSLDGYDELLAAPSEVLS
jgi:hypothetical protein